MTRPAEGRRLPPDPGSRDSDEALSGGGREPAGPTSRGTATCDRCGAPMLERHCKLVCPVCGYQRDCSDP